MHKKRRFREGWAKAAAIVLVLGAILTPAVMAVNAATSQPRDPSANSIIYNGCYTKAECVDKMEHGDGAGGHSGADISGIYKAFGITTATLDSSETVEGKVYSDGRVTVDENIGTFKAGDTVATNAWSVGRTKNADSTPFAGVWKRPVGSVFISSSITAFVNMSGNKMNWFMLHACGNAGEGTPTPAPKPKPSPSSSASPKPSHTPSPTPSPTHTPSPTPSMTPKPSPTPSSTPSPTPTPSTPPTPSPTPTPGLFSCVSLLASEDQKDLSLFHFVINAHVEPGVQVTGYLFSFSDQNFAPNPTDANTPTFSRTLPPGQTTAHGQVVTSAGTTDVSRACTVTVNAPNVQPTPSPTNSPTPVPTGQVLGTQAPLPSTGPETALGGVAGLTAIGMAGRAYLRSRKSLLDSLRKRPRK